MANSNLRRENAPTRGAEAAPEWGVLRRVVALGLLAVLAVLAGTAATLLHLGSQQPSFVERALGPADGSFRLARRWDALTNVSVTRSGIRIAHDGRRVSLAAAGAGSATWTRHAWGVDRPTPFGREAIVAAAPRTEEFLTVDRRVGNRTWRWRLDAGDSRPVVEADGSITLAGGSVHILPVAIYDRHGRDVTPPGSRFGLSRSGGADYLTLRLDDSHLPTPYTIDPIAIVGTPVTGNTKTGSPLPGSGTLSLPTGLANGNLLIASITLRDPSATVTIDSGIADPHPWNVLTTITPTSSSQQQIVYWKVWQTGDPTTTKWSWSGGTGATDSAAGVIAYSGVYTGASPIETFTTNSGLNATTASTAAGSNTFNNSLILLTYGVSSRDTVGTPAGTTSEWSITSTSSGPTVRATSQGFQIAQAAAGAIPAYSGAVSTDDYTAAMLSIAPAVSTPTAANSTVSASPTSVTADGVSTSTVTATLEDAAGNPVNGKTVTLTAGSGSSTITTVSGTTNAAGQATFTVKDAVAQSVTYTAKDTTDNVTVTQTASVTFTPGTPSASTSTVSASPTSVTANGASTSTITVTLKDANSNAVSGKTVTLAAGSGSSTITTVSGTTNASGQATFTVKDTVAEGVTYTATDTSDSVTVTQTATVTFTPGPVTAAQSTTSASPASVVADGSSTSTITVTLKDANSNPVSGKTVTLTAGSGSSTITTVSGTTNAAGQATFTVKDSTVENVTYTAKDTTDNVTVTQTATVTFTVGPVTAAQSTVSASPTSVTADGSTTSTVTVTLKDAQSRGVSGKTVTLTPGSGSSTVTTVSGTTNASGQATFTVKDTVAEGVTYTAKDTTDNVTVTQTATVTFTAGPVTAAQSTVSASPSSVLADGSTTSTVTVTLKDANSNPVSGKTVSLTAGSGSSTITTVSGTTNASGQATFTVKDSAVESVTYTGKDTTDNVTVTQTASVAFTVGAVTAAQSTVSAAPGSVTADGSTTSTVTVTLKDAQSHPVSGKTVTLTPGSGSSTVTTVSGTTNASGQATFTVKDSVAESVTYTGKDTTDNVTVTQTATVTFTPGPVSAVQSTVAAAPASVAADGSTTSTVTVTLKDANSNPVAGKTVTLTAGSGSSTITTVSGTTNAAGQATFTVKDSAVESVTYTGKDTTDNVTVTQTASVSFTAGALDAAASTVSSSPGSVVADGATSSTITVTAKDAFGHGLPGQSVSLAQGAGSSTITTVSGTTNASGQATFTVKDTKAETVTYSATIGATSVLQTASVVFTPGAATHFTVSAPASTTAGSAFSVTVTAYDANNNLATGYAGTVHFTSSDGQAALPSNYTFVPGTDAGAHTFTNAATLKTAGSKTVVATDTVTGSISGSASVTVNAAGASAAASTVAAAPGSVVADNAAASTVTATLTDAYGNPLAGKSMTLTAGSGSSTITTVSGTTNASGQASWTVKDGSVESVTYTAKDTTDNVTLTQTAGVVFTVGAVTAAQSTVSAAPGSVTADGSTTSTVTVTLKDAQSHPVSGKTVTLAKSGGSSTVTTVSGTTDASGQATFTVKDAVAETTTYTATDTSDAVTVTQTASVTFTPGAVSAVQSTVAAAPGSVAADGSTTSTVTVTLKDANGNAVPGKSVSLGGSPAGSTITTVSGTTNASGQATFTVKSTAAGTVTYTATDTTDSVTVTQTAAVTFNAGAVDAAQSTVSSSPGSVTADGSTTSTITVTAKDAFGNPVAAQAVSLGQGAGSSTITTVSGTTDAAGHATFTVKDTKAETVTYSATIGATSALQTAAVTFTPGAATHVTVGAPASATAGTAFGVTVTALDANNNVATGYAGTVHFSSSDGQAALPSNYTFVPGTDAGVHTFAAAVTLKTAGSKTVVATDTVTGSITGSASVSAGAAGASAAASTLAAAPTTVVADGSTSSTVTATVTDVYGNPLAGKTVTLAKSGGSSSVTTVSGTTNASGQATFTVADTVAETTTYTATDATDGVTLAQTAAVTFAPGLPTAANSTVSASPASVVADGSTTSTVTVTLKDAHANPVPGKAVTLTAGSGSSTITTVAGTTDASGHATFAVKDTTVESVTYTAKDTTDNVTVTQTAAVGFTVGPVTAAQSTVAASPSSVTADGATGSTVTVTLKDAQSHPVAGKSVSLAAGGGSSTITTVSGTTNASGQATFTVKDAAVETATYTATDTTDGVTVTQTASVSFTAGAVDATTSTAAAGPGSVLADGVASSTVTVTAKDAFGHPLAGQSVSLAQGGGSSTITTVSGTTDAAGHATFTVADTKAETVTYSATIGATPILQSASVTFTPGAATHFSASAPAAATAGASVTLTVTALDAHGNVSTGYAGTVHLSSSDGRAVLPADYTFVPGTDGGVHAFTVTLGTAGSQSLTATDTVAPSVTGSASVAVSAAGASAAGSALAASPAAVAADGSTSSTVTATIRDAYGNPLAGRTVTLAGSPSGSTITTVSGTTDAAGHATFTVASTAAGPVTYTATDTTDTVTVAQTATVTFSAGAVDATQSTVSASPGSVTADGSSSATITVTAKDAFGNPVPGQLVSLAQGGGASTITTVSGTTNAAGVATFTATDTTAEAVTYSATVGATTLLQTAPVTFTPGPATHFAVSAPASSTAGSAVTVTVTALDAHGNVASAYAGTVHLTSGDAQATLPAAYTFVPGSDHGSHTFTSAVTLRTAGSASVTAADGGVTGSTSVTVAAAAASASHSTVVSAPASVPADGSTASTVTVTVTDAYDNPLAGKSVTLAGAPTTSTITTVSGTTNAAGRATFAVKSTSANTVTYTATDATDGLTIAQTATVGFATTTPDAGTSSVVASPATVEADGSTTSTVTVTIRDANANAIAGKAVTLAKSGGSSTITTVSGTTNASGQATFTVKDAVVEATTYTASVPGDGMSVAQTATVTFAPGAPSASQSSVGASPATVTADGATASTVTVTVRDRTSHPVSGVAVSLAAGSGSSSVTPASATTNASGVAAFSVTDATAETVSYTATAAGTTLAPTASVTFAAGAANAGQTTITASPATLTAGGTTTITVHARDAFGNPLATGGAAVVLASDRGTLSSVTDNGDGTYTATLSWTGAGTATVTGTLGGVAIGHPASATFAPGPASAAQSTIAVAPASITADGSSTATVTVHAKDAYGNAVATGGATVALATDRGTTGAVTDNGDGTYTAVLTSSTAAGTAHVTGTLGGVSIGTSASVSLTAGPADAAHSAISVTPATLVADGSSTATITVRAKDVNGNALTSGGAAVALATDKGSLGAVTDNGDGTYTATLTAATTVGTAHLTGTLNGSPIGTPAAVALVPGAAAGAQSSIDATPGSVTADGSPATLTVHVRDAHGNPLAAGGATVALATDLGTLSAVTDNGDGTYTATLASTAAGTAHVSGTVDGGAIGSPASVSFTPGAANATHSTIAAAPATLTADGSSTSTITVRAMDANDNALTTGGAFVSLATDRGALSLVTDNGDGTYTATLTAPTTTGTAHVTGSLNGSAVGNPATVQLVAGPPDAGHTTIAASPSSIGADGATTSTITVQAKDAHGNDVTSGGAAVVLATDKGSVGAVTDNGDGTYSATLTSATTTGTAHVTGTLGAQAIGNPATVQFVPSAGNPAHSVIAAAPTSIVANGVSTSTITVQAKDANDNALTSGGATVVLSTDRGTLSSVTDNGDGTYTATLTSAATTGTAHVTGTLDGGAIGHATTVSFVPGAANAARSAISAAPTTITADGSSTATVTVRAKDADGNALTSGGATVALATDAGTLSGVTDNGDGTYTATLTSSTTSGTAHVSGTLNGAAIGTTATVTFAAGAASGAHSAISAAPATLTADGASTAAVTVRLKDVNDNLLAGGGATVALATDHGTLGPVTDNGDGTYSATLTAPTTAGTAHVTGTVNGQTIGTTASVSLVAGPVSAARSSVAASGSTASTDTGNAVTVTVTVRDAHDNPVQGAHVVLTQGGGTSAGISPNPLAGADTDAAGRAAFTVSDTVAESVVFSATAAGTLVTQTASVQFLPGADAQLAYGQQPGNTTAGATLAPAPTIRILDAHGNLTSSNAAVTLSIKSGTGAAGAALAGTVTRNAAGGVATFDDLSIAKAGSAYVLSAADAGVGGADSASFDVAVGAADAAHTTITAAPASINADGTSGTSTITVRARDASDNPLAVGGATVTLASSKGSLSGVTDNGDGTYTATLTATGESGTANVTGTLGGAAIGNPATVTLVPPIPVAAIDSGVAASPTSATGATFTFHSPNDDGNTTFACSLDGAAYTACTSPTSYTGLGDGSHTFRVRGVNANGPGASVAQSWTVDTTGPTATLTTAPAAYTKNGSEALAATASDATTSVAAVDFRYAATAAACPTGTLIATDTTAPYGATWTVPADGSYVVCAVATDVVGNRGPAATSNVVVDQTKPSVSLGAFGTVVGPTTYVRGTPSLHANASDATAGVGSVDFSFTGSGSGAIAHVTSAPFDATWDTTGLADGGYTVTATATDRAGNSDTSSSSVTVDNTPPTASLDDPGAYGNGTIALSVTASDTGSGVDTAATVVQSSPHGAGTWTAIADPAHWTPADGTYDVRAVVKDGVGNQTTTALRTIVIDNTAPTVGDDGDGAWHNSDVTLHLTATDAESGVASVEYKIDGGSWTTGTSVALPTSLGDGAHTVTYRATNRAGVTSAPATATVRLDATPPTVSDPSVAPAGAFARGTVDLSATVSDGTGSGIASTTYRLAPAGTPETTPPSACANWGSPVAAHFDTTTVADGTYDLRTVAIDNALNGRCSNVATATELTVDNTPPTTSDDAPFGAQNADVTVHLSAADNLSGVAATDYRVDGGSWTSGTSVTVAAPANHANDGTHTIEYRSTDNAGNVESTKTAHVTIDTTAPSGSGVDPASLLSGTVQLDASPGESDIASVAWLYRPAGSSGPWTSIGVDHAAPWQLPWITTAVSDGAYDLEAVFTDTTGNSTTQAFSTKTIDNTAPDAVSVTAPAAQADVSGTIGLAATAHDATAGIDPARTTFQVHATGDSGFVTVTGNTFDTTTKPDGPAQVRVAVWDLAGNGPLYSTPVPFVIDNSSPTVALAAPPVASGTAVLTATGSADIASVAFAVSPHGANTWSPVSTANAAPFTASWATGALADGLYDVRATATDDGGNTGGDMKTVRVDNTAPAAALTQPAAGATVGGAHVSLAATATDAGSGVASVTFQYRAHGSAGAFTDLSTTAASPYGATWDVTGLASGDYDLRVAATDAAGNTATSAVRVVTVDSTPPSLTAFTLPGDVSGTLSLHVTTSADTASVTYGIVPSGSSGWTQIGASSTGPAFGATFDTTSLADGTYAIVATAVDQYGNATTITVPSVRVDNTPPTLVASTPADGSIVSSLTSVAATASETLSAVTSLELDGAPASFAATINGASVDFPTGALADGNHALTGTLVDLAGNTYPFRINVTVMSGQAGGAPATSKNVSNTAVTTLGTADASATVAVPANVWQQALPSSDDWLVLKVAPLPVTSVAPTQTLQTPQSVVDVTMFWNLAGTEEHHFDAPIEVDLTDPTGGFGIAATLENGSWRHIPALDVAGTLPAGQADGFWRSGGVVHILTRHLSVFGVLNGLAGVELAPPLDFSGVVAADGLTLRWTPGIAKEQLKAFTLYVDGAVTRQLGPAEYEAKLGDLTSADTRRFTITETNIAGAESAPSGALRVVPPVAGLTLADATKALAARTFTVGKTIPTYAPQMPPGTVVGPTDVRVLAEGSAVDLQVATSSVVHTPFSFSAAGAPRIRATQRELVARALVTTGGRVDVTLDARPWVRIQRWHFLHVKPGATLLRLKLRSPLRPGTYRLFWKASSDVDHTVQRRVTPLTILARGARVHSASSPQVLVIGSGSKSIAGVPRVTVAAVAPEQAYLYATYHDVGAIVVDVDTQGLRLVQSLHTVFPNTAIVALSRQPSRLAAATRLGAVAVPASTPRAQLTKLLLALAAR